MTVKENRKGAQLETKYTKELHSHQSPSCFGNRVRPSLPSCSARQPKRKAAFDSNCRHKNISPTFVVGSLGQKLELD